uniref:SAP domain-containing protein n=1 Tax=Tetraselmis sp. GSL018 TaxID=582737 RepID=A0A061RF91_9CHLO
MGPRIARFVVRVSCSSFADAREANSSTRRRRGRRAGLPRRRPPTPSGAAQVVDTLLTSGELDIYSETKHQLQREADVYSRPTVAEGADEDAGGMFAEDSDEEDEPPAKRPATAEARPDPASGGTAGAAAGGGSAPAAADYAAWPVRELQQFLRERGQDTSGVVEKAELVERARLAAASAASPSGAAPEGYVFHEESGLYWGPAESMYFDASSGFFYNPASREWCYRDPGGGGFVPWAGGPGATAESAAAATGS